MGNRTIKQVDAGKGFDQEGICWHKRVITDESILALIEMRYNIFKLHLLLNTLNKAKQSQYAS